MTDEPRFSQGDEPKQPEGSEVDWSVLYTVTEEDLVTLNSWHLRSSPHHRRARLLFWCFNVVLPLAVVAFLLISYPIISSGWYFPWFTYVLLGVTVVLVIVLALRSRSAPRRAVRAMLKQGHGRGQLGDKTFTIGPAGISDVSECGRTTLTWRAVWKIELMGDLVAFYNGPATAYLVPERAFESAEQFDRFVDAARRFRQAAPSYEECCPECAYDLRGLPDGGCPECGWNRE